MAKHLIVDVETVGHPDADQWLTADPIEAPSNYTKPEAIANYIAKETAKRKERLGLDLDCNRIVCFGMLSPDWDYVEPRVNPCQTEQEEREMLRLFWAEVTPNTRIVTFNGARFDLPVILMRSLLLNVPHPELVIAPAWKTPHIDLWEKLSWGGARKDVKGLQFYGRSFGFPQHDDISGGDVARLVTENTPEAWNMIVNHCSSDIALTHLLAHRLGVL